MDIFFADDSVQKGHRSGMNQLVAMGGLCLREDAIRPLKDAVDALCDQAGVPSGTELKWSPGRNNWLRDNLQADERSRLFSGAVRAAGDLGGRVVVVVWDTGRPTLKNAAALRKVLDYLLERVTIHLGFQSRLGLVICDRPGGGHRTEDRLLADVLTTIEGGTEYVKSTQLVLNMVATPSHLSRQLQVADLVTGSTTAMVAGETRFASPIFAEVRKLMLKNSLGYIGGTSLKLFPDNLTNLYHYVLGEDVYVRPLARSGIPLPWKHLPYYYDGNDSSPRTDARGNRSA